ncbi:PDZ domain-containing protein [Candidatus Pacearchaeota archaeon]|nr:PDZ domain-containing protein [Candidatus Pacearchaeota archaeon]
MKLKFTWKIWLLIILLALSLISIFVTPNFLQKGALVINVDSNSTAFEQGLRQGQVITAIDGQKIESSEEFLRIIQEKFPSEENIKTIIQTKDSEYVLYSKTAPEIIVSELPKTNIKMGLDLAGGSRALVQAKDKKLTPEEVSDLVSITSNRFNVYGISDIKIRPVSDLTGNNFMLIEIAGATHEDLEKLISEQGKFEAKVGEEIVFIGGDKDITSVSRSGQDSGIYSCDQFQQGHVCNFRFSVYLSEKAAEKFADITKDLEVNASNPGYLNKKIDFYLDDNLVNSLQISEGLKGSVTTQVSVSGSGKGETRDDAILNAEEEMKQLQTVLITGSLPFKLEIVKLDTISPTLGKGFLKSIFLAGLAALLAVAIIIFFRYKKFKSSIALLITSISEIIIILGVASLIKWDLDLPSIAGILATIGTGIDSQIIVLDEAKQDKFINIKQRLKRAFVIILGTYFTALAALIPLYWAVAGLFKGFAITTIIGITTGVLITRPAFADMIRKIEE